MAKRLFFVRHGSVYNPNHILYHRLPGFHLSEQGGREAEATAGFLSGQPLEIVWHSPMERAEETARAVARAQDVPLAPADLINEWDVGESSDAVLERMAAFFESWKNSDYEVAAAVSHRDPIRRLLFHLLNREWPEIDDATEIPLPQGGVYLVMESMDCWKADLVFVPPDDPQTPRIEVDKGQVKS